MPNSTLDPSVLVDSLVPDVIDGLRRELYPSFGVRPYRVWLVQRTWAMGVVGDVGGYTDTETEIGPRPRVQVWDGIGFKQDDCGLGETGSIRVTEVSLTYNLAELLKPTEAGIEHLVKIAEGHGQGNAPMYFTHERRPFVDREQDMGWVMWLRLQEGQL